MGDVFKDYIKKETERMAMQAEMAMFKDEYTKQTYIIVKDTPDNITRFNKEMEFHGGIPENVVVFYNEPKYYDLIIDGYQARHRIKEEKERQERIDNPEIDEDIKSIDSKDELFDFLLEEFYSNNKTLMDEFSGGTYEEDEALLDAEYDELMRLKEKYLN